MSRVWSPLVETSLYLPVRRLLFVNVIWPQVISATSFALLRDISSAWREDGTRMNATARSAVPRILFMATV